MKTDFFGMGTLVRRFSLRLLPVLFLSLFITLCLKSNFAGDTVYYRPFLCSTDFWLQDDDVARESVEKTIQMKLDPVKITNLTFRMVKFVPMSDHPYAVLLKRSDPEEDGVSYTVRCSRNESASTNLSEGKILNAQVSEDIPFPNALAERIEKSASWFLRRAKHMLPVADFLDGTVYVLSVRCANGDVCSASATGGPQSYQDLLIWLGHEMIRYCSVDNVVRPYVLRQIRLLVNNLEHMKSIQLELARNATQVNSTRSIINAVLARENLDNSAHLEVHEDGTVLLALRGRDVDDLSVLENLPITWLILNNVEARNLSPLKTMPLRVFQAWNCTNITDCTPLGHSKLSCVSLLGSPVTDIGFVRETEIVDLTVSGTDLKDLRPIGGLPLSRLYISGTNVKDLSPLAGMSLLTLGIEDIPVSDLSVLTNCFVRELWISPERSYRGLNLLAQDNPSLYINRYPATCYLSGICSNSPTRFRDRSRDSAGGAH